MHGGRPKPGSRTGRADRAYAILACGGDIEALHEQRGAVRDQRSDLPKRDSELRQLREQAHDLLRRLGSDLPIERAVEAIPPRSILADVRALIAEEGKLRARADAAADQLARCRTEAGKLKSQLEAIGTPADPAVLHAAVAEAKRAVPSSRPCPKARPGSGHSKSELPPRSPGLPLWHGTLDELIQAKVPDESTVTRFEGEFAEFNTRTSRAREKADEFRAQLSQLDAEIATLKGTSEIPTADAIAEARRRRDLGWSVVRRTFIDRDQPALTQEEAELFDSTHDLPGFYESSVRSADALVDRKEAEAQRVARYA